MRFKKNIYDKTFITTVGNAVKLCTVFTGLIFLNTASHVLITTISNYFVLLAQICSDLSKPCSRNPFTPSIKMI